MRALTTLLAFLLASSLAVSAQTRLQPDLSKEPTLYVVAYSHLDTQWRWEYPRVINEYIPKTMHDNFALLDKYPNYVFNFSGANRYRMMKEYWPADYARVKRYVAAGRWFPAGSSMEEGDVNVPSAESIIRQILYGNRFFQREFGKTSAEYMLPDCFGFPASLPSILAHTGIKGFSTQKLTWNSAAPVGGPGSIQETPPGIPFNVGYWQGPDGRGVIAALNPGSYGGQIREDISTSPVIANPNARNNPVDWPRRVERNGKVSGVFTDYHYYGTGDTGGAPREDSVRMMEAIVTRNPALLPSNVPNVGTGPLKVVSANAEQMFLNIRPDMIKRLPRYEGDLLLTDHSAGSLTSQAYQKRWNRKNELLADAAERASIAAIWLRSRVYPQERLNNAWTLVMGGQFHDILPGTSTPKAFQFSWNDDVIAMNQFASVLTSATEGIASSLDTRGGGEVPSHQWFDLTDRSGTFGVTILTDCKYGSDKPDDKTLGLTLLRTPGIGPRAGYADQATQDWGRHEIVYGLVAHDGDWRRAQTDWQAQRLNQPLFAFQSSIHAGMMKKELSILTVDNSRVRVLALKKAEDTDEIIVRVVELDGRPAPNVRLKFPGAILTAREVNGQELPVGPASIDQGQLVMTLGPFQPRTFAVRVQPESLQLPVRSVPITLPYDLAVANRDGQRSKGGFDGEGYALPAEMLPGKLSYAGITFNLAPASGANALVPRGQEIAIPAGVRRLYVLAASAGDDQDVVFRAGSEPVNLTIQSWSGFIGQWDDRQWKRTEVQLQPRTTPPDIPPDIAALLQRSRTRSDPYGQMVGITPGFIKRAPLAWFASHRHTPAGTNEAYAYSYLFAYTIDLPANAKTLTLPNNDHVRILAITGSDETRSIKPAHALYDTLERNP